MYTVNVYDLRDDRLICWINNQTEGDVAKLLSQGFKELRLEVKRKV